MRISRQDFAEVTVAEIRVANITRGQDAEQLRDFVTGLLKADRRHVVLDLQHISNLDSTGLSEMASAWFRISRAGGRIVVCHQSKKMEDIWAITRLQTFYQAYRSVTDAVNSFRALGSLEIACPACGSWFRTLLDVALGRHFCTSCRATVGLADDAVAAEQVGTARVASIIIPTYEGNALTMSVEAAPVIKLPARLDLFSSEAVEKIWRLLPLPRRAIIDISEVQELSMPGMAALFELGAEERDGSQTAFLALRSANAVVAQQFAAHVLVHTSPESAGEALGLVGKSAPTINVSVRRSGPANHGATSEG
jgi:anti-sigma B factor antagonist